MSDDLRDKKNLLKLMGARIRSIRESQHQSREAVSNFLDVSPGFIGYVERGSRGVTAYNLYKLSILFEKPIDNFFPNKNELQEEEKVYRFSEDEELEVKKEKINMMIETSTKEELDCIIGLIQYVQNYGKRVTNLSDNDDERGVQY